MARIPFENLPAFSEEVVLDGIVFRFFFAWNYTKNYWSFSIHDGNGVPLLEGQRIVLDLELLRQYPGHNLPPGQLFAVDPSGNIDEPSYDDLVSGRVELVYFPVS